MIPDTSLMVCINCHIFKNLVSRPEILTGLPQASSLYPRLEIPQDLPRQSHDDISLATLHGYGITHAITLDGTPDGKLAYSNIYVSFTNSL